MIDYTDVRSELNWLRQEARLVARLGTEMGIENKTDAEIQKETEDLVMQALLTAIRRYDPEFKEELSDTPETLYSYLWHYCYYGCYEQRHLEIELQDIEREAIVMLYKEVERVYDYLYNEYNCRFNQFKTIKEEQI
jgi:hypothetical protein